jgi:putative ABC transporter
MNWYLHVLKNYATFSGRARRKEYWMFFLISALISIVLTLLDILLGTYSVEYEAGLFSGLYSLLILIPSIAVVVRRLHDTDRSGWWILISLIPLIGVIVLFVFICLDSQPGTNRFGANPKEAASQTLPAVETDRFIS